MDHRTIAPTPPMGWNSYDYYDTTVDEAAVRENARFMARHLKAAGWEYVVVDIQWYAHQPGSQRERYQYLPFGGVELDKFSRLLPDPGRFPSSAGGRGFAPLAGEIHDLGLKFGIHIMRGIPRIAAHSHAPVQGSSQRADQIADPVNICFWNPDMYGLRPGEPGSQAYYNSLFELYAAWGVDFVKCDDICRLDMPTAKAEIAMLDTAIKNCGRPMVFSLSPGPARLEEAWYYRTHSQMWRITDDFWDHWPALLNMFERCEQWQDHVGPGSWPDCDMLPVGMLGKGFGQERPTRFTRDEQMTMLSLWGIFRSPLMLGAKLPDLDDWTLGLLTNADILAMHRFGTQPRQLSRSQDSAVWFSQDSRGPGGWLGVFNLASEDQVVTLAGADREGPELGNSPVVELWSGRRVMPRGGFLELGIPAHGVRVLRLGDYHAESTR